TAYRFNRISTVDQNNNPIIVHRNKKAGSNWSTWVKYKTTESSGEIFEINKTITSAELTNSGTTKVNLLPDPGVVKINAIEKVVGFMEAGTTPYDGTGIKVKYGNDVQITNFSGTFSAGGNDIYEQQLP